MNLQLRYLFLLTVFTTCSFGSELDELLNPKETTEQLVDESANKAWLDVVDAFRRNDIVKANELGTKFLKSNHRTSPYQLLGVQVMLGLANAENPAVTSNAAHNAELKRLMDERNQLRTQYANLQAIISRESAVIDRLTLNRTQAVQQGTQAFRDCSASAARINQAEIALVSLQTEIDKNKINVSQHEVGTKTNLKSDTIRLLDMLIEANEIEAAFAIANVYIRVAGSDLDIAKKQQDVIRLREDQQTADKIVSAIESQIEPLAAEGKGEEAKSSLMMLTAKVEASNQTPSVKKIAIAKLKALKIRVESAKFAEERNIKKSALDATELSERLTVLEQKLEVAQDSFGTVIRSIEGYAEFTGEFAKEEDKSQLVTKINQKIKTGEVSKERAENMIKSRSDHAGIIRELDILERESTNLSVVQRGRIANLRTTALSGISLLKQIAP
jgi:hypothetical protein